MKILLSYCSIALPDKSTSILLIFIYKYIIMGTASSTANRYTTTHEDRCQKFGTVEYVSDRSNLQFQGIRIAFDASSVQSAAEAWQQVIIHLSLEQEIKELIVLPVSYGWNSRGSVCDYDKQRPETYEIVYNSFYTTLATELKLRIEKKIPFSEEQIWFVAYILLKVSSYFETHSWHLGNIHPKNIMIDKDGGIKVFTTLSSPVERQNCEEIKESKYNDAYLAPEETVASSSENSEKKTVNKNKIDTFYIGLVMLSLACLKDLYFLFDHCESSIKLMALGQLLLKLKRTRDKYSFAMYSFVESMLDEDPEVRNMPSDYFETLQKYEEDITQMNGIDFQTVEMADFNFSNHKKYHPKRNIHSKKQITFLTLSKKYKEQAFKTNQKLSKLSTEAKPKSNQKLS